MFKLKNASLVRTARLVCLGYYCYCSYRCCFMLLLFVDKVLHLSVVNIICVCQEHCTKLHCSISRQSMRCVVRNFVWSVFEYVTIVCVWKNDDTLKQFFTRCRFVPFDPHCCGVSCANRAAVSLS